MLVDGLPHHLPPPPVGATARRLVRNTLANGLGSMLSIGLALLLTPLLIHRLGLDVYGVYVLVMAFSASGGYAALFDLGLPQSVAKYVAEFDALNDTSSTRQAAGAGLVMLCCLAVPAAAFLGLFGWLAAPRIFSLPSAALADAMALLFLLLAVEACIEMPSQALSAVLVGYRRYDMLRVIDVGRAAIFAVFAIGGALGFPGPEALPVIGTGLLLAAAVTAVARLRCAWLLLGGAPILRPPMAMARRILGLSASLMASRSSGILYRQMDKVIIGCLLPTASLAVYDVASKLHRAVLLVPTVLTSAILPTASVLAATDDRPRLRELFLRGTKLTAMATLPVASVAFILAVPLLDAWLGEGWGIQAGPLARIVLAHIFFSALTSVTYATAAGTGKLPELLPWILAALAVNLLVSLALVGPLGLEGVFWGTLAGHLALFLPGLLFSLRSFGVSWRQLFSEVLLPVYPLVALHAAGLVAVAPLASRYGVAGTLSLAAVALACWIPVATGLGLRPAERATLKNALSGGDSPPGS